MLRKVHTLGSFKPQYSNDSKTKVLSPEYSSLHANLKIDLTKM